MEMAHPLRGSSEVTCASRTPSSLTFPTLTSQLLNHLYFTSPSTSHMETKDHSYTKIIARDLQKPTNSLTLA